MVISMGMLRAQSALVLVCGAHAALAQQMTFTEASLQTGLVAGHSIPANVPQSSNIAGGCVGDFNNDGWPDLFVLGCGTDPDRLFINDGDGTFTERAAEWGIAHTHYGVSATAADFDADGFLDISVTSTGSAPGLPAAGMNRLYRNNGNGTFTDVAQQAGVAWRTNAVDQFATAFGDYDNDGDLDMFSTAYSSQHQGNRLWRNNLRETGAATFTDATADAGLDAMIPNSVSGYVPGFADMNQDGNLDIILVADTGTSRMYRGLGDGTFADITPTVQALNSANGMGLAIGDVNMDGLLDFYVSSIYWAFLPTSGNRLFIQRPDGGFDERGRFARVNACGWGWGVAMADLDHDGLEDIMATKYGEGTPSHILKNNGNLNFSDISVACGFLQYAGGRGLVNVDLDNDGDQDVIVFSHSAPLGVWRNDLTGPGTNWLRVNLDTLARPALAPGGFHSTVRIKAGNYRHLQHIDGATNHCSSGDLGAHFGLAQAETLDYVRVEWRDGTSTTLSNVPANQILDIAAPAHPGDFNRDGLADLGDVVAFIMAYLASDYAADLDGDEAWTINDRVEFIGRFLSP